MKNLEVGDSEQLHAAFLVYMDLSEGECPLQHEIPYEHIRLWTDAYTHIAHTTLQILEKRHFC